MDRQQHESSPAQRSECAGMQGPGAEISLRLGQRVRHMDYQGKRVTGAIRGLSIDSDRVLMADIVLDAPIVIPALSAEHREVSIWHQHVPAHELAPFDERDEVMAEMLAALRRTEDNLSRLIAAKHHDEVLMTPWRDEVRSVIAKATGSAA